MISLKYLKGFNNDLELITGSMSLIVKSDLAYQKTS